MFLDNLSKKTLNTIGIISIVLASIMLILVIALPILLKRQLKKDYIGKCNPSLDNTDIWASFPGKLDTKLLHTFSFFDYETINEKEQLYKINYKSNVTIEEQVNYTNFKKEENTIYFFNNRTYKNVADKSQNEEIPIKSINLGLFEALETMSYPPLYKVGIDSIYYLKKKVLLESDLFIRELFTYNLKKELSDEEIRNNILTEVTPKKVDHIFDCSNSKYSKYSLNVSSGIYEWVKLIGSKEQIANSKWLTDLFELTESEVNSVLLNEDCYLVKEYKKFNENLAEKFKCKNQLNCGEELIYKQLIDSSVISSLFNDIKTYKELNTFLGSNYYPFDTSPEMKIYFDNEYSKQKDHKTNYDEVAVTKEQLEKFVKDDGKYSLLSLENSINILHINKTDDSKKDIKYFDDLSYDNVNFLANYFYDNLPKIFLYPKKTTQNPDNSLDEADDSKSFGLISKTVSNLLPKIREQTFDKISHIDILSYLEPKTYFVQMKKVLSNYEFEEMCPVIYQKVLNDAKKVFEICQDDNINFHDYQSLYKFIQLYYCQEETKDEKKCDNSIAEYLKNLKEKKIYISDIEIISLVQKGSIIDQIVTSTFDSLVNKYGCPGPCTNEYLLRLQFAKARVTKDPPESFEKADNLSTWFPELEDDYEIINILKKKGNEEPFEEQDAFWIVDTQVKSGELYDLENTEAFRNKIKFEKEFEKGLMNDPDKNSLVKLINFLLGIYVFNSDNKSNSLIVSYSSIDNFLKGKSDENQYWIDYLKSGNYFENYKPKISEVTKFDFGFNFDTKEEQNLDLDYIGISTRTSEYNKRRIDKMNDLLTLNIKKEEYDIKKDSYTNINFPLYNFEKLLGERKFCDGFQYDNSLEVIYYYDLISSRPLRFKKKEDVKYKDKVECKKYFLETEDLSSNINENFDVDTKNAMLVQKVNKPFMLKFDVVESLKKFGYELKEDNKYEENYICVDPISDMVIDSKMNFIYAINARKYGLINKNIGKDTTYPLFHYQRNYEINVDSYESIFPGVTEYYAQSSTLIIVGVILIVVFVAVALVAFIFLNKKMKQEKTSEIIDTLEPLNPALNSGINEEKKE